MYIVMNRFRVLHGSEDAFETVWKNRQGRLSEMSGFVEFRLLRGPDREDHRLYSSHTLWRTREDFLAWTQSEQFRAAHKNAGQHKVLYAGPPELECFETVVREDASSAPQSLAQSA